MTEILNLNSLCRCCHAVGDFNSLEISCWMKNISKTYHSMLDDAFGLKLDPLKKSLICDRCIIRLCDAYLFKRQVLSCEKKFEENCRDLYFCQHCNGLIESLNEAGNHKCFRGKEYIYQSEEDNILYVKDYEHENKENHKDEVFNHKDFEANSSLTGYTANVESDEGSSDAEDSKTESNVKKNFVWTKKATMAMLSLYEANIQILKDVGKKAQVWKIMSEGLKNLNLQVTADQVKWKFNRLNSKYKECIDNNNKSGRGHMTFEYYEQFEQMFHKDKNVTTPHTFSSSMLSTEEKKRKHDVNEAENISTSKKIKLEGPSSEKSSTPVDESVVKTAIQSIQLLPNLQENQKSRDEKMTKYLEIKEKEMKLKKKVIDVCEIETQIKRDVASEKLKFNEKKHKDWLNVEKLKCELLKKLLKSRTDSEE